jgi:cytochrome c peroxidase
MRSVRVFCVAVSIVTASAPRAAAIRPLLGLDLYRPAPETNPLTPERIALGRRLFGDRRLSRDDSLSCASCHDPRRAFTDGRRVARGVGKALGTRNTPAILNRAWGRSFFWDGRAATLEQQVLEPILNPRELAMTPAAVLGVSRSSRYRPQFVLAFGRDPTIVDVARALASYVRSIEAGDSVYDRYVAGDRGALSASARRGLSLFQGKAGCTACHTGPLLSDESFHNTGVAWRRVSRTRAVPSDEGRAQITHAPEDRGAFKTPTLREVSRTAPYMHDGSFADLAEVIEYYDRGGEPNPQLDPKMRPLHLSAEDKRDLVAFLRGLTGGVRDGR